MWLADIVWSQTPNPSCVKHQAHHLCQFKMLHVDLWVAKRQVRLGQKFYKNTDLGLSKLGIGRMDVGLLEYRENGGRLWINNTWLPSNLIVARLMIPILIDIPRLHWDNVCEKAKDLSAMMVAHAHKDDVIKELFHEPLCILNKVAWDSLLHFLGGSHETRNTWAYSAIQNKVCFRLLTVLTKWILDF